MTGLVVAAVLVAALLHASWNAIAKAIPDQRVAAGLISASGMLVAGLGAARLPPPDRAAWPYILASSVLSAGYLLLLTYAYRHGDFGQVYPLTRGVPPLLVTVFAIGVLGEQVTGGQIVGVVVISFALTALVFSGGVPRLGSGLGLAALAGVMVAGYTVVDGVGVRASGDALSYAVWRFLAEGPLVITAGWVMFGRGFWRTAARSAPFGLLGGVLALGAFAIVVWAQRQAPLALVSALRETSLLFAGIIGTLLFNERFSAVRSAATVGAVVGIVVLLVS